MRGLPPSTFRGAVVGAAALTVVVAVGADLLAGAHNAHVALVAVVALALGVVRTRAAGRHRLLFASLSALIVAQPALHAAVTLSAPTTSGSGLHDLGPDSLTTFGNMAIAIAVAVGVGATEALILAADAGLRSCWAALLALLGAALPPIARLVTWPQPVRTLQRAWLRIRPNRGPPRLLTQA